MKITGPTLHPSAHDSLGDWSRRDLILPHVPRLAKLGFKNIIWGWTHNGLIEDAEDLAEYFDPVKVACKAAGINIIPGINLWEAAHVTEPVWEFNGGPFKPNSMLPIAPLWHPSVMLDHRMWSRAYDWIMRLHAVVGLQVYVDSEYCTWDTWRSGFWTTQNMWLVKGYYQAMSTGAPPLLCYHPAPHASFGKLSAYGSMPMILPIDAEIMQTHTYYYNDHDKPTKRAPDVYLQAAWQELAEVEKRNGFEGMIKRSHPAFHFNANPRGDGKYWTAAQLKIIRDGKPRLWDRSIAYMLPTDVGAFLAMME